MYGAAWLYLSHRTAVDHLPESQSLKLSHTTGEDFKASALKQTISYKVKQNPKKLLRHKTKTNFFVTLATPSLTPRALEIQGTVNATGCTCKGGSRCGRHQNGLAVRAALGL